MFENREISAAPVARCFIGSVGEGLWPQSDMYAAEKSDIGVLPERGAEQYDVIPRHGGGSGGKAGDQGEILESCLRPVRSDRRKALNGLDRIREAAAKDKNLQFTNLMHHITIDLLRASYYELKRNAAARDR